MRLIRRICSLAVVFLLTACPGMPGPQTAECPPRPAVRDFSKDEQKQIAAEHNRLQTDDVLRVVLEDWERMRRGLR